MNLLIAFGVIVALTLGSMAVVAVLDARNLEAITIPGIGVVESNAPTDTTQDGVLDPKTLTGKELRRFSITVLNGTTQASLGTDVANLLVAQSWKQPSVAAAADTTIEESVVIFDADENLPAAKGVAAALGIKTIKQSDQFPGATVTVLIGSDFVQN